MFGSYVSAAIGNLVRNRLYAAISIIGLSIGFTAAILIGLYVRDEFTFDRFVPGHERIYLMTSTIEMRGSKPIETKLSQIKLAERLPLDFPEIELAGRLANAYFPQAASVAASDQEVVNDEAQESVLV